MNLFLRLGSLGVILVGTTIARGDALPGPPPNSPPVKSVPKPEEKPAPGPTLTVPVDISYVVGNPNDNGNIAGKITIPAATLKALAELAQTKKSGTLPLTSPSAPTSGIPHGGTIIAGLALSLALVSMVYLSRRPSRRWAIPGAVAVLLAFGVTGYLWANLAIPDKSSLEPPKTVVLPAQPGGKMVLVEIVEQADRITITVPPKAVD